MTRLLTSLTITLLLCTPAAADDWRPWEAAARTCEHGHSHSGGPLNAAIQVYQRYISPVDGARCSMYPTCSAYAAEAVQHHGPLLGSFIFVDRLYHENDPIERQKRIVKYGYYRYYDPLINNTFWLTPQPSASSATQ